MSYNLSYNPYIFTDDVCAVIQGHVELAAQIADNDVRSGASISGMIHACEVQEKLLMNKYTSISKTSEDLKMIIKLTNSVAKLETKDLDLKYKNVLDTMNLRWWKALKNI